MIILNNGAAMFLLNVHLNSETGFYQMLECT